jgi:hypothetical protein
MNWNDGLPGVGFYKNRPVLCYCPEWNDSGYQVAFWNGKEFIYPEQPNERFGGYVERWALFLEAD